MTAPWGSLRRLAPLALALALGAAEPTALAESGPAHAAVVHALTSFAQGDATALLALPDEAFTAPPALADPAVPGLYRRWTGLIPWEVPAVRALGGRLDAIRAALATRGALQDPPASFLASAADWSPPEPGVPVALAEPPPSVLAPLQVRHGNLLACDGGAVVWQIALEPGTRTWIDGGSALVSDSGGLRWIGLDGIARRLPPLPSDVAVLGLSGGAAFFAQDGRGWRLSLFGHAGALPGDRPAPVDLGAEPLGPPLGGADACLWLTMSELVRWDGRETRHWRHGLPAGRGWRLGRAADGAMLILAPDRRAWSLPDYHAGDAISDERLGRFADLEARSDLSPAMRLRAALRHRDWAAARALAGDAPDRATVALYAGDPPPPGATEMAPLPLDPAELALPEAGWSGGIAPRARALPAAPPPAGRMAASPLLEDPTPWPDGEVPARTRDGLALGARTWLVADDGIRAEATCRDDGAMRWFARWLPEPGLGAPARALALLDDHLLVGEGDARLLAFAAATGTRELDLRPRRVPVLPGRTWLRLRREGIAGAMVLHPPGIDDRLGWLGDGGERVERLPGRARWILALPDGERWLALADGSALACQDRAGAPPGAWVPLHLPPALVASDDPPSLVEDGVAAGGRRWRWR